MRLAGRRNGSVEGGDLRALGEIGARRVLEREAVGAEPGEEEADNREAVGAGRDRFGAVEPVFGDAELLAEPLDPAIGAQAGDAAADGRLGQAERPGDGAGAHRQADGVGRRDAAVGMGAGERAVAVDQARIGAIDGREDDELEPVGMDAAIAVDHRQHHVDPGLDAGRMVIGAGGADLGHRHAGMGEVGDEADRGVVHQRGEGDELGAGELGRAGMDAVRPAGAPAGIDQRMDVAADGLIGARQRHGERMRRDAVRRAVVLGVEAMGVAGDQREDRDAVEIAVEQPEGIGEDVRLQLGKQPRHQADRRRVEWQVNWHLLPNIWATRQRAGRWLTPYFVILGRRDSLGCRGLSRFASLCEET